MAERVVDAGLEVVWAPNHEHGVLIVGETGQAVLRLEARSDDPDRRRVLLTWQGVCAARMEPPNDEARSGHRLYEAGLRDVTWLGEVLDSSLIADLEMRNRLHPRHDPSLIAGLRHWVVPLKGSVVEIVGRELAVRRQDRPPQT